jgi:hypothetical protein
MDRRLRRFGIVAVVALAAGTSGCGLLPSRDDSARLHQQAQAALTRWTDAVAAAGGQSAFIPVGELTAMVGDDWGPEVGDNDKRALMAGLFEAVVTLPTETPPDGDLHRQDGSIATVPLISAQKALSDLKADAAGSSCPECVPLQITGARLTTGPIDTSRGPAVAPIWEFTLQGTAVRVTRVAIADRVTVVPPPWDSSDPPAGISIESATGTVAGRQLTVAFTGAPDTGDKPCGADYTAEAVESPTAAVVIVTEHANGLPVACSAVGARRTAEAELSTPLAERAVLEVREGRPVAVLLTR